MSPTREFLDFKAIKARVTMADVLAEYRVTLARANTTTLKGNCPLPSHTSGSKNTFYVNEAKSVWYCHSDSCKKNGQRAGGNIIDFVAAMERCSAYDAAKKIDGVFPASGHAVQNTRSAAKADSARDRPEPDEAPPVMQPGHNSALAFTLKDVNASHPMIQGRGISAETAASFGVGFFPGKGSMAGRIVFPLHEYGNLVGYAGRTTLPISDANPKWLLGKGLRKTFLYGLDRCDPRKPLILCESLWAPLWFHEHGVQAASLMGSEMTEEQERCLDPYPVITVALDNDPAGAEKAVRVCERLKPKHRVSKAKLVE
jgi:DNA primase